MASHNEMQRVHILSMQLHLASSQPYIHVRSIESNIQVLGIDRNRDSIFLQKNSNINSRGVAKMCEKFKKNWKGQNRFCNLKQKGAISSNIHRKKIKHNFKQNNPNIYTKHNYQHKRCGPQLTTKKSICPQMQIKVSKVNNIIRQRGSEERSCLCSLSLCRGLSG